MVRAAKRDGLSVKAPEGFEAIPGCGVKASFGEHLVEVGADRLMTRYGIDITRFADEAARLADEGKSPLYAVVAGRLAAVLDRTRVAEGKSVSVRVDLGGGRIIKKNN